jgi:hypothetical protein
LPTIAVASTPHVEVGSGAVRDCGASIDLAFARIEELSELDEALHCICSNYRPIIDIRCRSAGEVAMGWLRDLMEQSDSGCRSYGELARAALKSTDWPTESKMGERSLASILSKLDRSQEADWLAERVGVQRVLSKVLGVPLDDLRAPATRAGG